MDFHTPAIRPLHSAGDFDGDPDISLKKGKEEDGHRKVK
jgi:hypothetical protein